ncbi:MAG: class I SAM-dependent methyltransferase, partial [Mycobacteriaceae bacterium]
MTTLRKPPVGPRRPPTPKMSLADIVDTLSAGEVPLRFTAYDGSSSGPADAKIGLHLASPRGATYLATAPGDLGMARAYVSGDLQLTGVHPGDPYDVLVTMTDGLTLQRPSAATIANITRSLGWELLKPIAPPAQEAHPRWRRLAEGLRHSKLRDAEAISKHYDVSNTFYEHVLGPSMTYTCATFATEDTGLEDAQ